RWNRRFTAHIWQADVAGYSAEQLQAVVLDVRRLRILLEPALRDCDAALELNQFNARAHYNRLLALWDGVRLDVLQFILELVPLTDDAGGSADGNVMQQVEAGSDPAKTRLRAEFGDISHRVREIHDTVRTGWAAIRAEARLVGDLQKLLVAASAENCDDITAYLIHCNEAYFEVTGSQADALASDAADVLGLFERASDMLDGEAVASIDTSSYSAVLRAMVQRWQALSVAPHNSDSSAEIRLGQPSIFSDSLFGDANDPPAAPRAYLWHRRLCDRSMGESSTSNGDDSSSSSSDSELTELSVDTSLSSNSEDQLDALFPSSRGSQPSASQHPSSDRQSAPSSPLSRHRMDISGRDESTDSSGPASLRSGSSWPRATREFLPAAWDTDSEEHSSDLETPAHQSTGSHTALVPVPVLMPARRYKGHCNVQTIKDVNFALGGYVASGSDDGSLFLWDRQTMDIVQIVRGDSEVVNIVESHPALPIVAVSGIDSEVQIFGLAQGGPAAAHRRNFPMVRPARLLAAGLRDPAAQEACVSRLYAPDPYGRDLERAGHSPLPQGFDVEALGRSIERPFPAVSTSMLATAAAIADRNEDMRI
ncbi:hypothetical protein LPJ70_005483, partial [Coemansia sp. RSA 2708]